MCHVPRIRRQRNGAASQQMQPAYAGFDDAHLQETAQRISWRYRLVSHASAQRRPDSQNLARKWREATAVRLDRERLPRLESVPQWCDFKKQMIKR